MAQQNSLDTVLYDLWKRYLRGRGAGGPTSNRALVAAPGSAGSSAGAGGGGADSFGGTGPAANEGATSSVSFGPSGAGAITGGLFGGPVGALAGLFGATISQAFNAALSGKSSTGDPSEPNDPNDPSSPTYGYGDPSAPAGEPSGPSDPGSPTYGYGDPSAPGAPGDSDPGGGPSGGDPGGGGDGDGGGDYYGGYIKGNGQKGIDNIPIRVTAGEYVLPKPVVDAVGKSALDKLLARVHSTARPASARGYEEGGIVDFGDYGDYGDNVVHEDPNAGAYNDPQYEGGYSYDPSSDPYGGGDPYAGTGGSGTSLGDFSKWLTGPAGMSLLGKLGATGLGVMGARNQANKFDAQAQRYEGFGAPSRGRYEASFQPGFTMANDPGYTDALNQASTATLHGLSTQGNPAGSPNAWARSLSDLYQKTAYPALQNYRNQNASTGGFGAFNTAAPGASTNATNAGAGVYNAVGAGVNDIFNPQPSLMEILKQIRP